MLVELGVSPNGSAPSNTPPANTFRGEIEPAGARQACGAALAGQDGPLGTSRVFAMGDNEPLPSDCRRDAEVVFGNGAGGVEVAKVRLDALGLLR